MINVKVGFEVLPLERNTFKLQKWSFANDMIIDDLIQEFDINFNKCDWKHILNFKVKNVSGHKRTINHEYEIKFLTSTIVQNLPSQNEDLYWSHADFGAIISRNLDLRIFVGKVLIYITLYT